jgi:hypothetical protein
LQVKPGAEHATEPKDVMELVEVTLRPAHRSAGRANRAETPQVADLRREGSHARTDRSDLRDDDRRIPDTSPPTRAIGEPMSLVSDPCMAPEDTEQDVLLSGAVIQGKYLVHRVIGRG